MRVPLICAAYDPHMTAALKSATLRSGLPAAPGPARPPVVLVGQGSVVGLQTARLLADRGVAVIGLTRDAQHFAARTRACARIVETDVYTTEFVDRLERLGPRLGRAVLVPCTDQSALLTAKNRDRLEPWYAIALPEYDVLHRLADKGRFRATVGEAGLRVPRTAVVKGWPDLDRVIAELRFPVVMKPTVKSAVWQAGTAVKVVLASTPAELINAYRDTHAWTAQLVVQEYVGGETGELFTINAYYDARSRPLASCVTRKVRQWPPRIGIASYAVECRNDDLVSQADRLFQHVGFVGLGYLEAKRDPDSGELLLIEANVGRPTGRSATAEAAGVELLMTMYADLAGLPLPPPSCRQQRFVGAGWVDVRRDALAVRREVRRGRLTWRRALAQWRRPRIAHAVWSARDPLPFALDVGRSIGVLLRRRWPGRPARRVPGE